LQANEPTAHLAAGLVKSMAGQLAQKKQEEKGNRAEEGVLN